ncbi:MAG: TetR family transcriptional regulator [Calditrichaeota bacterium]|nr:MAG: TetR family transcriptional regulator [Calditrichota bacterium]MBL1208007.1 TetR family transcriptional regulator [Calditrichota bacterium]NOG47843.1 TetR family transcriptional regulator [Calditrichota bacterium]
MGATKEQAEKTRQDLLATALIVFSNKGFNATRLEDISNEAGVTRGAFYWHFKNKKEIFCTLYRQIMNDFIESMKNTIGISQTPLQNLKSVLLTKIIELLVDENARRYGRLFYAVEYTPEVVTELEQIKKEMEIPIHNFFSSLIDQGKDSNEIRQDMETESIFLAAISTLQGTVNHIFDGILTITENDVKTIVNIFVEGIKNKTK